VHGIQHDALQFEYELVDLRQIDAEPLVESASLEDNLLAILCRLDDPSAAVRRILTRLAQLPAN
jgi:hypothetical protein